jgi:hypothetical protein
MFLNKVTGGWRQKMRFVVLTAVRKTMLFFWVVTPCRLVGSPEKGDRIFIRNVGIYL